MNLRIARTVRTAFVAHEDLGDIGVPDRLA
jgi:hypothetical protein